MQCIPASAGTAKGGAHSVKPGLCTDSAAQTAAPSTQKRSPRGSSQHVVGRDLLVLARALEIHVAPEAEEHRWV